MKRAILYTFTFLAIQFVTQFLVVAGYAIVKNDADAYLPPVGTVITMVLFSLITLAVFIKMRWYSVSRSYLRSRPWDVLAWCVVASLGAIVPSLMLQSLIPEWTGWAKEVVDASEEQMTAILRQPGSYIVVALLPPVVEELVFRGAVLGSLLKITGPRGHGRGSVGHGMDTDGRGNISHGMDTELTRIDTDGRGGFSHGMDTEMTRKDTELTRKDTGMGRGRKWAMIALSAAIFSLAHLNPAQMLHTFLIGMLLGWLYMRTGSIIPGVAYHWANNTAAFAMFHIFHNPQTLTDIVGPSDRQMLLALLFSLCILIPALFQLNIRMKKVLTTSNS